MGSWFGLLVGVVHQALWRQWKVAVTRPVVEGEVAVAIWLRRGWCPGLLASPLWLPINLEVCLIVV